MALFPKKTEKTESRPPRTLADFPEHAAAVAKLDEMAAQRDDAEKRFIAARDLSKSAGPGIDSISRAAVAIVEGRKVKSGQDLTELQRDCQILAKAVELQQRKVDEARRVAAREIAEDMAGEYWQLCEQLAQIGRFFLSEYEKLAAFKSRFASAAGGAAWPLHSIDFSHECIRRFRNDVGIFSTNVDAHRDK